MKYCTFFAIACCLFCLVTRFVGADDKQPANRSSSPAEGLPEKHSAIDNQKTLGKAIVDRFDTNGNGQIDADETQDARAALARQGGGKGMNAKGIGAGVKGLGNPQRRQAILKRFDANGNGTLDPAEREVAKAAIERIRTQLNKEFGNNGVQGGAKREALLKRFDTNRDGKLDSAELQAAKAELEKLRDRVSKK